MNKELIQKAIDHISRDDVNLGACSLFASDKPCCALGHMASLVGVGFTTDQNIYADIGNAYGLTPEEVERVYMTNDGAKGSKEYRKQDVLNLLKGWLEAPPDET